VSGAVLVLCLLACVGCGGSGEDTVGIYGYLFVGPQLTDPPLVLSGARLEAYDAEGRLLATGSEPWDDTPGYYRVRGLPPSSQVHLMASIPDDPDIGSPGDDDDSAAGDDDSAAGDDDSADGDEAGESFVTTLLTAWTPEDNLYAYDGEMFMVSGSWLTAFLDELRGPALDQVVHPGAAGTGGFVIGSLADPVAGTGSRIAVSAGDVSPQTLYFHEDGKPSNELDSTSEDGWFAVFGLPEGPVEVRVTAPDGSELEPFTTLVAEDACTSLVGLEVHP